MDSPPSKDDFFHPKLSPLQTFLANSDSERDALSNTIELWDAVPKYFVSRNAMAAGRHESGMLPTLKRRFEYRDVEFVVEITPARISGRDGEEKDYYPSSREELVEDALRKIAAQRSLGFIDGDDKFGVSFTIMQLRRELAARGHAIRYQEAVESLEILNRCNITIRDAANRSRLSSPVLPSLLSVSKADIQADPRARWHATFNGLICECVQALTYRQYNYAQLMSYRSQLARWLHRQLAHVYTYAAFTNAYALSFQGVKRNSGLLEYTRERAGRAALEAALDELEGARVLSGWKTERHQDPHHPRQALDVIYHLSPHASFVAAVKAANRRNADARRLHIVDNPAS